MGHKSCFFVCRFAYFLLFMCLFLLLLQFWAFEHFPRLAPRRERDRSFPAGASWERNERWAWRHTLDEGRGIIREMRLDRVRPEVFLVTVYFLVSVFADNLLCRYGSALGMTWRGPQLTMPCLGS